VTGIIFDETNVSSNIPRRNTRLSFWSPPKMRPVAPGSGVLLVNSRLLETVSESLVLHFAPRGTLPKTISSIAEKFCSAIEQGNSLEEKSLKRGLSVNMEGITSQMRSSGCFSFVPDPDSMNTLVSYDSPDKQGADSQIFCSKTTFRGTPGIPPHANALSMVETLAHNLGYVSPGGRRVLPQKKDLDYLTVHGDAILLHSSVNAFLHRFSLTLLTQVGPKEIQGGRNLEAFHDSLLWPQKIRISEVLQKFGLEVPDSVLSVRDPRVNSLLVLQSLDPGGSHYTR